MSGLKGLLRKWWAGIAADVRTDRAHEEHGGAGMVGRRLERTPMFAVHNVF